MCTRKKLAKYFAWKNWTAKSITGAEAPWKCRRKQLRF